jgi:hypothetical protein
VVELTDDFDLDVKDPVAVRKKLEDQGVLKMKSVAVYGYSESASPPPLTQPPSSPATAAGDRPMSAGRRETSVNAKHGMRSSIVFG